MKIRSRAEFHADFPDDMVEDEHDIILFSGRGVAEAIAAILQGLGYDVSTPEHQQENGWDFDVKAKGKRVWMQVSHDGDLYYLQTEFMPTFRLFVSPEQIYAPMLERLNAELANDTRFHDIKWYYRMDSPGDRGAAGPLIE